MPLCECGFNFAKARVKGRRLESYAAVRDRDWLKLMRKESAILSERKADKRLAMIGDASRWVGNLMRCPKCGSWLFLKPAAGKSSPVVLLKAAGLTRRGQSVGG
jgi:DNA-directed RNA polymerase subunit RPC12/RpoP